MPRRNWATKHPPGSRCRVFASQQDKHPALHQPLPRQVSCGLTSLSLDLSMWTSLLPWTTLSHEARAEALGYCWTRCRWKVDQSICDGKGSFNIRNPLLSKAKWVMIWNSKCKVFMVSAPAMELFGSWKTLNLMERPMVSNRQSKIAYLHM